MELHILKCARPKSVIGWLIEKHEKTNYSHYAIGFTSNTGRYMILDATSKNVALKDSIHYLSHYKVVETQHISIGYPLEDFRDWYEPILGESYGYMQLFGIMFKNKSLGKGIVCNELVLRLLKRFTNKNVTDMDIRGFKYTDKLLDEVSNG